MSGVASPLSMQASWVWMLVSTQPWEDDYDKESNKMAHNDEGGRALALSRHSRGESPSGGPATQRYHPLAMPASALTMAAHERL